jgi:hypothetical protein
MIYCPIWCPNFQIGFTLDYEKIFTYYSILEYQAIVYQRVTTSSNTIAYVLGSNKDIKLLIEVQRTLSDIQIENEPWYLQITVIQE